MIGQKAIKRELRAWAKLGWLSALSLPIALQAHAIGGNLMVTLGLAAAAFGGLAGKKLSAKLSVSDTTGRLALGVIALIAAFATHLPLLAHLGLFFAQSAFLIPAIGNRYGSSSRVSRRYNRPGLIRSSEASLAFFGGLSICAVSGLRCMLSMNLVLACLGTLTIASALVTRKRPCWPKIRSVQGKTLIPFRWKLDFVLIVGIFGVEVAFNQILGIRACLDISRLLGVQHPLLLLLLPAWSSALFMFAVCFGRAQGGRAERQLGRGSVGFLRFSAVVAGIASVLLALQPNPVFTLLLVAIVAASISNWAPALVVLAQRHGEEGGRRLAVCGSAGAVLSHLLAGWIRRNDHPSRPRAIICSFCSSFKTLLTRTEDTLRPGQCLGLRVCNWPVSGDHNWPVLR